MNKQLLFLQRELFFSDSTERGLTCRRLSGIIISSDQNEVIIWIRSEQEPLYVSSEQSGDSPRSSWRSSYVSDSSMMMFRQYPEWGMNVTLPMYRSGRLVWYCNKCGLFYQELRPGRK